MLSWIKSLFFTKPREPEAEETWYQSFDPENPFQEVSERAKIIEVKNGYVQYQRLRTRKVPSLIPISKVELTNNYSCSMFVFVHTWVPPEKIASLSLSKKNT